MNQKQPLFIRGTPKRASLHGHLAAILAVAALATVALSASPAGNTAQAAGLLIADNGFGGILNIEQQDVRVTINNGIAVTRVEQVFRNTENRVVEALYTFPVPKGASVSNFSMWINGRGDDRRGRGERTGTRDL